MLLSATLENADREFSEIVTLAENFAVLAGEMDPRVIGDPISTVAFKAVTTNFIRRARIFRKVRTEFEYEFETDFVRILITYGISSVREFAELLRRVPLSRLQKFANYLKKTDWYRIPQFVLLATDADGYCRTLAADQGDWIFLESVWRYFDEVESEVPWRAQAEEHGITIHSVEEEAEENPHSFIFLERAIGYFVDVF